MKYVTLHIGMQIDVHLAVFTVSAYHHVCIIPCLSIYGQPILLYIRIII